MTERGSRQTKVCSRQSLEVANLTRYRGEREALSGVSFSATVGSTVVVIGPNGAGKSTLLQVLATLLRPHGGQVKIFDEELPARSFALRGKIGLLTHQPLLYRELSARENLTFYARLYGCDNNRVDQLLEQIGLMDRCDEPVRMLSAGMVRRVDICRAVLHQPKLLLLDEPYTNLDPTTTELLTPLLAPNGNTTRILTSHNPQQALAEGDLIVGLRQGKAELVGRASEVSSDEVEALYR